MKVAIVGSRDWPALEEVKRYVEELPLGTVVVSGGARGVDKVAEDTARACGFVVESIPVTKEEWRLYGKSAGPRRNRKIVAAADVVVAFQFRKSNGTQTTIDFAKDAHKLGKVFERE